MLGMTQLILLHMTVKIASNLIGLASFLENPKSIQSASGPDWCGSPSWAFSGGAKGR